MLINEKLQQRAENQEFWEHVFKKLMEIRKKYNFIKRIITFRIILRNMKLVTKRYFN